MKFEFNESTDKLVDALNEIMKMENLSDFASDKGAPRLTDMTKSYVRQALLRMPAFIADSQILSKAVNKEYFDKMLVFMVVCDAIINEFMKEDENEANLQVLTKLMQLALQDLLLELRKADEEKLLQQILEAQRIELEQRIMSEALMQKQIQMYAAQLYNISVVRQHLEDRCEALHEEIVDSLATAMDNPERDEMLKEAGIDPDSEEGRFAKQCIAEECAQIMQGKADKKQPSVDAVDVTAVKDAAAKGDVGQLLSRPKVVEFGQLRNYREKSRATEDLKRGIKRGLAKAGVDRAQIAKISTETMDAAVEAVVESKEFERAQVKVEEQAVEKAQIKVLDKAEKAVEQDCVENAGGEKLVEAHQLVDDSKTLLAARRAERKAAREGGSKKTGLR